MDCLFDYYLLVVSRNFPGSAEVKNRIARKLLESDQVVQALGFLENLPGRSAIIGYVYFNREHDQRALFNIFLGARGAELVSTSATYQWIVKVIGRLEQADRHLQSCVDTLENLQVRLTLMCLLTSMTTAKLIAEAAR